MDGFEKTVGLVFFLWFVIVCTVWGAIGYVVWRILTHNHWI